jgi:hypothetical protein
MGHRAHIAKFGSNRCGRK